MMKREFAAITLLTVLGSASVATAETVVVEGKDGSVTAVDKHGNTYSADADGTEVMIDKKGNAVVTDTDGNTVVMDKHGNAVVEDADGNLAHVDKNGDVTHIVDEEEDEDEE